MRQILNKISNAQISIPEGVTPFSDAVALVHHNQGKVSFLHHSILSTGQRSDGRDLMFARFVETQIMECIFDISFDIRKKFLL